MSAKSTAVIGVPIETTPALVYPWEIIAVNYDLFNLIISVVDAQRTRVCVVFQGVEGFRVLDEHDLIEFWISLQSSMSLAFRIDEGRWYDHESKRGTNFLTQELVPNAKEFLFTGCNDCVSVISQTEPKFVIQAKSPTIPPKTSKPHQE